MRGLKDKGSFVEYARDTVPKLVSKILLKNELYKDFDVLTRTAISMGRMRLNPICETL